MTQISDLQPKIVWKFFDEILKVPRPSKKEEKIIAYLEDFAKKNKLDIKKDHVGNILITKPATAGYENAGPVILQSHVDMVCEKNSDVEHDFEKDPIEAYVDGDWLKAKGTTLGADNGIGVAAQLAVLTDETLQHPKIECLFTIDEETGLTGAANLAPGFFEGKTLINLDSEDDGEIFIGCAGGVDTVISMPLTYKDSDNGCMGVKVRLTGLKGGHSGDDINKGFGNSNLLLIRFLWNISLQFGAKLCDFQGGNLRNAIPREAHASFTIQPDMYDALKAYGKEFESSIKNEYMATEPDLKFEVTPLDITPQKILEEPVQSYFLSSVYSCPNGVIAMSHAVPGLVETSTNLASIHFLPNNTAEIVTSQRSSVESAKQDITDRIRSNFAITGAKIENTDPYPGWIPNTDSTILRIAVNAYMDLFNEEAKVRAIHAGLECGLFLEKYPELDMVSIGPTLRGVHSPDERIEVATVEKFWKHLVLILESLK